MLSVGRPRPPRTAGESTLVVVVMGVSGSGKSTVAAQLADALGLEFLEGDALHSPENVERMASGTALTDSDRQGWLVLLSERIRLARSHRRGLVLACSALKRVYRDLLRRGSSDLQLVHLTGSPALLAERLAQRQGHYMPAALLGSQLAALEPPQPDEMALTFSITGRPETIVRAVLATLAQRPGAD